MAPRIEEDNRKYPLKRPSAHKVEVPRWTLKLPSEVTHIYTVYVGVQFHKTSTSQHGDSSSSHTNGTAPSSKNEPTIIAEELISTWLHDPEDKPSAIDTFRTTHGYDLVGSKIWVAYFTDPTTFSNKINNLNLLSIWSSLGEGKKTVGIWCEYFITPVERLETNYASLKHQPGLAQLPGVEFPEHNLTAYWGAGRDRIPAAAWDLFKPPAEKEMRRPGEGEVRGYGERLVGGVWENCCHIRSGQWWTQCSEEERKAYEDDLQITLMKGMQYLWDHPDETGTIGLRFLQNLDGNDQPIRETCGAGFHRNWEDLEQWSSRHPSHLAIFNGATRHAKRFGPDRNFMTWHEVSILKEGEARVEYVNCDPCTGVMRWVGLEREELS